MGKTRGVVRTKSHRTSRRDSDRVAAERRAARVEHNWRVTRIEGEVVALEPGREFEQVFDLGSDPFWDAVQFAARCLRGEADPSALP
jgi:hypothetical protein